jgi:hypothetical protein
MLNLSFGCELEVWDLEFEENGATKKEHDEAIHSERKVKMHGLV